MYRRHAFHLKKTQTTQTSNEKYVECKQDADCASKLACFSGTCRNPYIETKPYGANAECLVVNILSLRTMICLRLPGYIGDANVSRKKEPPKVADCENNATCKMINILSVRTMICVYPSDYISRGTCKMIQSVTDVACITDSQCPSDRACVNVICINPFNFGLNTECHVKNNKLRCLCVAGYEENPNFNCVPAGCRSDSDYPVRMFVETEFTHRPVSLMVHLAVLMLFVMVLITELCASAL